MNANCLVLVSVSLAMVGGIFCLSPAIAQHGTDVSLIPIAADEPIPPMGFPPLPAKLDLPIAQTAPASGYKMAPQQQKMYGGGYVHAPLPTRDAFEQPAPATYANQQPQREPTYQRSSEANSVQHVDAPQAVRIDQAHSQDLSLPDDGTQPNSGGRSPSNFSRNKQQLENNLIRKPLMNIRSRLGI